MRKGICKYCGEEFEYSNRGKERGHCRKEECLKKAKNEAQKKWYANKVKKEAAETNAFGCFFFCRSDCIQCNIIIIF